MRRTPSIDDVPVGKYHAREAVVAAALSVTAGWGLPARLAAQDNYEIQVYAAELVAPAVTMFELHSNFTFDGRKATEGGLWPTQDALHETLEITHGFTSWFETGCYVFSSYRNGQGWQWVGDHIRPRVRVPESWGWPVGVSLSMEVGYQRSEASADTWTWEIRPIIDKQLGRWYLGLNPALERSFRGPSVTHGFDIAPAGTVGFDVSRLVNVAAEYYGTLGSLRGLAPAQVQEHQLFGVFNLNFGPAWEVNVGVGKGFTRATDHLIGKMILGRRI